IRKHILKHYTGRARTWGSRAAGFAGILSGMVFVGQIAGKWQEGGWVVLISFSVLVIISNLVLISPIGARDPVTIHRIVRDKARVQGAMASIVEWQSLRMQEYRHSIRNRLLLTIADFMELFGIRRVVRYDPQPTAAGDYDGALHVDHPEAPSLLEQYLVKPEPRLGGAPRETAEDQNPSDEEPQG
ncbi:MAG TPA: hypothetical protein VEH31_21070, partial [Streptosporangiaceae bacterium]|nr:hypothetical protein [Streptosporangiaceae bacterium]